MLWGIRPQAGTKGEVGACLLKEVWERQQGQLGLGLDLENSRIRANQTWQWIGCGAEDLRHMKNCFGFSGQTCIGHLLRARHCSSTFCAWHHLALSVTPSGKVLLSLPQSRVTPGGVLSCRAPWLKFRASHLCGEALIDQTPHRNKRRQVA